MDISGPVWIVKVFELDMFLIYASQIYYVFEY